MTVAAWLLAVAVTGAYASLVAAGDRAASDLGVLFAVLMIAAWGYLTVHHERSRTRARRPRR